MFDSVFFKTSLPEAWDSWCPLMHSNGSTYRTDGQSSSHKKWLLFGWQDGDGVKKHDNITGLWHCWVRGWHTGLPPQYLTAQGAAPLGQQAPGIIHNNAVPIFELLIGCFIQFLLRMAQHSVTRELRYTEITAITSTQAGGEGHVQKGKIN